MDKRLLDILCCPVSKTPVRLMSKHELEALNAAISAGRTAAAVASPTAAASNGSPAVLSRTFHVT